MQKINQDINKFILKESSKLTFPEGIFDGTNLVLVKQQGKDGYTEYKSSNIKVTGSTQSGSLYVSEITCHGELSKCAMNDILIPALMQSKGYLRATCVFKGGETGVKLTSLYGIIELEAIGEQDIKPNSGYLKS